tara:strand:+ start:236 stop:454 length:219 start_codon:yes stop_codon:yes gene_type:complete
MADDALTSKRRAAARDDAPPSTAPMTRLLISSEYGFMATLLDTTFMPEKLHKPQNMGIPKNKPTIQSIMKPL